MTGLERAFECSRKSPGYYKFILWAFCLGALLGSLAVIVFLFWAAIHSEIYFILIFPIAMVIGMLTFIPAMFRHAPIPPHSYKLDRKKFAETYQKIGYISKLVRGPKITHIYIDNSINAAVTRQYSFLPGFRRSILLIGYPVLCLETARGLCGILAHEIGHLSMNHSLYSRFIVGILNFWQRVAQDQVGRAACFWLRWYLPAFNDWCTPLFRKFEEDADRFACEAFGEDDFREGIILLALYTEQAEADGFIENLMHPDTKAEEWSKLNLCAYYREAFAKPLTDEQGQKFFDAMKKAPDQLNSEHPPYSQRIGSMGWQQCNRRRRDGLEKTIPNFQELDEPLNRIMHELWDEPRREFIRARALAKDLCEYRQERPCRTVSEAGDLLHAMRLLGQKAEALEMAEKFRVKFSGSALSLLFYGSALFDIDKENGFKHIMRAIEKDPRLAVRMNDFCLAWLMESGDQGKLNEYEELKRIHAKEINFVLNIYPDIGPDDELEAMDAPPSLKEEIVRNLQKHKVIKSAYLVRKYPCGKDYYAMDLVAIELKNMFFSTKTYDQILHVLNTEFYNDAIIFLLKPGCSKQLDRISDAKIY